MSAQQYEAFFDQTDTDKSGTVSFQELKNALAKKGYTDAQVRTVFASADDSGDGQIDKDEFMRAMGCAPPKVHKNAAMRTIFQGFDNDGSGQISRDELKQAWTEMNKTLSEAECDKLMKWLDKDGDNMVNYEELLAYFNK